MVFPTKISQKSSPLQSVRRQISNQSKEINSNTMQYEGGTVTSIWKTLKILLHKYDFYTSTHN